MVLVRASPLPPFGQGGAAHQVQRRGHAVTDHADRPLQHHRAAVAGLPGPGCRHRILKHPPPGRSPASGPGLRDGGEHGALPHEGGRRVRRFSASASRTGGHIRLIEWGSGSPPRLALLALRRSPRQRRHGQGRAQRLFHRQANGVWHQGLQTGMISVRCVHGRPAPPPALQGGCRHGGRPGHAQAARVQQHLASLSPWRRLAGAF